MDGRKVSTPIWRLRCGWCLVQTERARTVVSVHSGRIEPSRLDRTKDRVSDLGCASFRRIYSLEIIQNPTRGRTCGFGDKVGRNPHYSGWISHPLTMDFVFLSEQDRRPIAPALIAKLVATNEDGSLVPPE
jgi:hypothetical protein